MTATKTTSLVVGAFPDDVPDELIDEINVLASRDVLGQAVPSLLVTYTGKDGKQKTLLWQPATPHERTLKRLGLGGAS